MLPTFTIPSSLSSRVSMSDPLGFRGVAQHYLHRLVPGFTSRVKTRGWLAILCWGAWRLEEAGLIDIDADESTDAEAWRRPLRLLARCIRLSALATGQDDKAWRYGNRAQWWLDHRNGDWPVNAKRPPFHPTAAGEIANGALGCLRRPMERLRLFQPAEDRLFQAEDDLVDPARSCRIDANGRILAEAFHADLLKLRAVKALESVGLKADAAERKTDWQTELRRCKSAIPFDERGQLNANRFPKTAAACANFLRLDQDPMVSKEAGLGPWGVSAAWICAQRRDPSVRPPKPGPTPWHQRLILAYNAMQACSGPKDALFPALGRLFLTTMEQVFPQNSLDGDLSGHRRPMTGPLVQCYQQARDHWLAADDALTAWEAQHDIIQAWCPRIEIGSSAGKDCVRAWIEGNPNPTADDLIDLHCRLPRFANATTRPLFDRDGDRIYLDQVLPWGEVENDVGARTALADDSDDDDRDPEDLTRDRTLQTDYWFAVRRAHGVLAGGV